MSEMYINYKNGTTKEIRLLNRFSNGEIRFVSESGERYMMTPDGTFAKDGVRIATKVNEKGEIEYSGEHAYVVDDTIQSISYPSSTEFHYTISDFSGVVKVRPKRRSKRLSAWMSISKLKRCPNVRFSSLLGGSFGDGASFSSSFMKGDDRYDQKFC